LSAHFISFSLNEQVAIKAVPCTYNLIPILETSNPIVDDLISIWDYPIPILDDLIPTPDTCIVIVVALQMTIQLVISSTAGSAPSRKHRGTKMQFWLIS